METKIQKWGNSQGLKLPTNVLKQAGISVGDRVMVSVKAGVITIRKIKKTKNYLSLSALLKQSPKGYKSDGYDWGKPMGREVW